MCPCVGALILSRRFKSHLQAWGVSLRWRPYPKPSLQVSFAGILQCEHSEKCLSPGSLFALSVLGPEDRQNFSPDRQVRVTRPTVAPSPGWGDRRCAAYNHTRSVSNDRCTTTVFLSAHQALLMLLPSRTGSYRCRLKFWRAIRPSNRSADTLIRNVIATLISDFARIARACIP